VEDEEEGAAVGRKAMMTETAFKPVGYLVSTKEGMRGERGDGHEGNLR